MSIRTGAEYRSGLKDGRTIYVNGERVKDVTVYPPFQRIVETLAALYDLQHHPVHQPLLTYPSPKTGNPVSISFLITDTADDVARRIRAEEFRAEATLGLMGRLPDFMNAMVTDAAVARSFLTVREPRFGDNIVRYYEECRESDLCLTHTLVDPQIDRSKGPAEQADPEAALHRVRETDRGLIVRGARMLSTLAPFSDEIWVGPFYPRKPGEESYALCFALPVDTPGLKFICREPYDTWRSRFDRPLSSRFDEEDALAVFDDVLVPWERVFINGDIEASNSFLLHGPGYALLQATVRGVVKLRFLAGLACHLGEAIGRTSAPHIQAQLGELVAKVELGNGLLRAAAQDVVAARREGTTLRALAAALWVFIPEAQMRSAEVIRQLSGSGLILTPTERDFDNPEIAPYLEKYLQGKNVGARQRVQLFKLAWDLLGEQFGSRQLQYEWFYAGDPIFTRSRFYHSPAVSSYKEMVDRLLENEEATAGPLALR
jgi:4-hydroxyphenylacetate 3-monooxygenase/anthranilate 3-monooxygenase (FAD)/4-hydroxyphenylacetate 3-monooxygenase